MPTYQYACTNPECRNKFELVQSFTDPAASECPVCAEPVRKVFSPVGVVFKGSGFYRTDSRAGNGKGKGDTGSRDGSTKEPASTSSTATKSDGSASATAGSNSTAKSPAKAGAPA